MKTTLTRVSIVLAIVLIIAAAAYEQQQGRQKPLPVNVDEPAEVPEQNVTITLTAAGDCLMHNTQIWSGLQENGSYSFPTFFADVQDLIKQGDYSSTNFEAPMAGAAAGYSGYPLFNSPDAAAEAFKDAGFDLIITANNHILDKGFNGAVRTMQVLHEQGLDTAGTYLSAEDREKFLIKDIRGVKVGYLAYSYSTNGLPVPAEHPYFFNFLDQEQILADIKALRPQVDVVVLVLHWGVEYSPQPTNEQKNMARQFLAAGADIILGSHPHVIQPMEVIEVDGQEKFVIYSMGNFISHQTGLERNSGVVLKVKFSKDLASGKTVLSEVAYTPTYSHYYKDDTGKSYFRVVPVEKTIKKIEEGKEPILTAKDLPDLKAVLEATQRQLGPTQQFLNQ
ncbi:MAG TPA: CapA family protein [Syntrophomonadaceae bacterium]|nr:CapA family protein [Syntrophomonadaceae bacterium]